MSSDIKHYIWKLKDSDLNGPNGGVDIETRFPGLKYSKCSGLLDKGGRTNVYTETYADSGETRVWQGETVITEPTTLTLTIYFIGDSRHSTYGDFYSYVSNDTVMYFDTVRKTRKVMILIDAVKPKEDVYKGSTPYLLVDFKFKVIG